MIFSLIILALVGAIAFFHYVQGMFSATLSAIIAVVAAVLAVSYAEPLVAQFFENKLVDYAYAIVLVSLFAVIYIVLRLVFDAAVPGNIRLPVIMDKVGAGAMGVIAGIFATGVFALAAESLPFGMSFGMYSLYEIRDSRGTVPIQTSGRTQRRDAEVGDELAVATLEETDKRGATWIPSADLLVGLTRHLSDGGSLAGSSTLDSINPDPLQAFYGQRLGQTLGEPRVLTPEYVSVKEIFSPEAGSELKQYSSEIGVFDRKEKPERSAGSGKRFVIVRVEIDSRAAGAGGLFRFSTGSVYLVAGEGQGADREWKSYYPVGTLDKGSILFASHPEDPLYLKPSEGNMIDFVFAVDTGAALTKATEGKAANMREGTFIVVKRNRIDLAGKTVKPGITPEPQVKVLRKEAVMQAINGPAKN